MNSAERSVQVRNQRRFFGQVCDAVDNDVRRLHDLIPDWSLQTSIPDSALSDEIERSLNLAGAVRSGDCYAYLRALTIAILDPIYRSTLDDVELLDGDPFPLPSLDIRAWSSQIPPYPRRVRGEEPLVEIGYAIYQGELGPLRLSFSMRHRLDSLATNGPSASFPIISSIHPFFDSSVLRDPDEINENWWFGTGPRPESFAPAELINLLRTAKKESSHFFKDRSSLAVLPELSHNGYEELSAAIHQHWRDLPELIVLGSAHLRQSLSETEEARRNESRVYLSGVEVLTHNKRHPFQWPHLREDATQELLPEGLMNPLRFQVLSGSNVRLAVLICADALDELHVRALERLGVNLVAIPTLTPMDGGFSRLLTAIAEGCQGVCVVANGSPPSPEVEDLFLNMTSVPRQAPSEQTIIVTQQDNSGLRRCIILIDPISGITKVVGDV